MTDITKEVKNIQLAAEALKKVAEALSGLEEDVAKQVLIWATSMFSKATGTTEHMPSSTKEKQEMVIKGNEIPGIAMLQNGEFKLTLRDLKTRSTNDAAIRLAHVIIYANEKLTGNVSASSSKIIVPYLKEYRAYNGNTRKALKEQKGIIRNGDMLSLDAHSKQDAEQYIKEILDDSIKGSWSPSATIRTRKKKRLPEADRLPAEADL